MKDKQGPNVRMASIDGANHFFRDLFSDDVADVFVTFVGGE